MKIATLTLINLISLSLLAQQNTTKTYDFYKNRLNTKFCVVGPNAGQSIPVSEHKSGINADSINHWGDATITLGWYIGVLATEYEVNRLHNQNNIQTTQELYYAISALNRLDSVAEVYYGGIASLNGFFIRDDVSPTMIGATNVTTPILFNADSCLVSNYACGAAYCLPITTPCTGNLNNEESQDQFYHLLMGLSLCAKYCNVTHNGINLSAEAKAITNRLITYVKQNNWIIKNAVTGNNVTRGENTTAYSFGIATAGLNVTGIDYSDATTNGFTAQSSWSIFPSINFTVGASLTADNVHMFLATACVANDARPSVDTYASNYGMPIYPLIRQTLYGGPNSINDSIYTNLLDKIDTNGSYYYSPTAKSTGGTWYNENIFVWPDRSKAAALGTNTLSFTFGEYAGLDFMLLHNLMELKKITLGTFNINTTTTNALVFPNPNNSIFKISNINNKATTLLIYNTDGKQIITKTLTPYQNTMELNIEGLNNGVYIYKITDGTLNYQTGMLVVQDK